MRGGQTRQLSGSHSRLCMIVTHGLRHPLFNLCNSCAMARMSRKELGRLALTQLLHSLPDMERLMGVVPGVSRQEQSNIVRFRFMFPTVGRIKP